MKDDVFLYFEKIESGHDEELCEKQDEDMQKCIEDALEERMRLSKTVERMSEHEITEMSSEDLRGGIEFHFVNVLKFVTVGTD